MITCSQVTAGGTAIALAAFPAGPFSATIINGGTAAIFLGTSGSVSTTTGVPVPAGAVLPLGGYPSSAPATIYVIAAVPSVPVGVLMSLPR